MSSYGLSGTNVHVVMEQAPRPVTEAPSASPAEAPFVFPLSSTSADELRHTAARLADWVQKHDEITLPDLGYTLARRRVHRPVRTAVVASNPAELTAGTA